MAVERCASCDHPMTSHGDLGCHRKITKTKTGGALRCPCITVPPPPRCKAIEGATGIGCYRPTGHHEDHKGKHTPRTDGTESVGYWLVVEWPYTPFDEAQGIKPASE